MKKTALLRAVALCLGLVLVLSGCSLTDTMALWTFGPEGTGPVGDGNVQDYTHRQVTGGRRTIAYDDIEYARPDADGLIASIEQRTEEVALAGNFDELLDYDYEVGTDVMEFVTMRNVAMLRSMQNKNDSFYEEEQRYCEEASSRVINSYMLFTRAIVDGPFAEDYRELAGEYSYQTMVDSLLLYNEDVVELQQQRSNLALDYTRELDAMTMTVDGQAYTLDEILDISGSYEEYLHNYNEFYKQNAERFTELYVQMMNLDKEMAAALGFGSAPEMYYVSYNRDYTLDDAKQYFGYAKEIFAPIYNQVLSEGTGTVKADIDDTFALMPQALAPVSSKLGAAWQHMLEYGMHDVAATDEKLNNGGAFSAALPVYDTSFIYGYWDDTFYSTRMLMHEFGHYFDTWLHYDVVSNGSLDVAEIYSQGLELLLQEEFGLFTNQVEEAKRTQLSGVLDAMSYQAMLEEFQMRAYEMDNPDARSLAQLHTDLQLEYGFELDLGDEEGLDYTWFRIGHLFESPFYTISYWTSAAVALQIWSLSLDDWQAGADLYMELIEAPQDQNFLDLIQSVGLTAPDDEEMLYGIARDMADVFGVEAPLPDTA